MGYPIFVGVRGLSLKDVANQVTTYVNSLDKETSVDIALRVPVHVAKTTSEALENAEDSFMKQFRRLGTSLNSSTKQNTSDSTKGRLDRSTELASILLDCLLYTSKRPRDKRKYTMTSSA